MSRSASAKRPTNVSLNIGLVEEAKTLGLNVSQACERGLRNEIAAAQAAAWLAENEAAIAASNSFVETHALPLAALRQF